MDRLDRILFIPSARRGNGTGHLKRCAQWSCRLPSQNFYIPPGAEVFSRKEIDSITRCCGNKTILSSSPGKDWDLLILDNRETDPAFLPEDLKRIPLIAVDEAGPLKRTAPYVLATLPGTAAKMQDVNRSGFSFLDLPGRSKEQAAPGEQPYKRILVSFGGEDPAGLSRKMIKALEKGGLAGASWVFVEGPSFSTPLRIGHLGQEAGLLKSPEDLKDRFWEFDLVICSYGLTAFEALAAGTDILIVNPSSYHDQLSAGAGFPVISRGWARETECLFRSFQRITAAGRTAMRSKDLRRTYDTAPEDFVSWVSRLTPGINRCPFCGSRENPAIHRYPSKSYFKCSDPSCGIVYMVNYQEQKELYRKAYFFEDYQKQYGKTYLEDFDHIKKSGFRRLDQIDTYRTDHKRLLDVGCALGPFLAAAQERGYQCYGIDVSEVAVDHIRRSLPGIRAEAVPFEDFDPERSFGITGFDLITLWYVIEHFKNPGQILARMASLLSDGGVLAFSTPHGKGVSGVTDPAGFHRKSPDDHYTVWDRRSTRRILKAYGFHRIRFVWTGYHPERIPVKLPCRSLLDKTLLLWFCRLFRLGDTFEIYAYKKGT